MLRAFLIVLAVAVLVLALYSQVPPEHRFKAASSSVPRLVLPNLILSAEDPLLFEARFQAYTSAFGKVYASDAERAQRIKNFAATLAQIEKHNGRSDVTYSLGVNQFSDWTDDEFMEFFNLGGMKGQQECSATKLRKEKKNVHLASVTPPARRDWRDANIVSPVKNQGHCGSCWTFSTTGALEAHWKQTTGQWVSLSEQQLVDCAQNYDNHGCSGGLPSHAFEYIMENGGLDTERGYPYLAADGKKCNFRKRSVGAKVTGVVNITQFDEQELQVAVGTVGPVSVAFQVASDFRSYAGGVYTSTVCGNQPKDVNHAVLAVGYDVDANGKKYWIIKNSWGEQWGLQGYFWMERGKNMCGVSDCASYPIVA